MNNYICKYPGCTATIYKMYSYNCIPANWCVVSVPLCKTHASWDKADSLADLPTHNAYICQCGYQQHKIESEFDENWSHDRNCGHTGGGVKHD